jgi:hypothetical protein
VEERAWVVFRTWGSEYVEGGYLESHYKYIWVCIELASYRIHISLIVTERKIIDAIVLTERLLFSSRKTLLVCMRTLRIAIDTSEEVVMDF